MESKSILTSIKKLLGLAEEYVQFDIDIIIHINSALFILTQLGVGPIGGFAIKDKGAVWSSFVSDEVRLESIKSYVYMKVRLLFDPPISSAAIKSMEQLISELEWRILVATSSADEKEKEEIQNE